MGTGFKYVGSLGVKLFVLAILLFSYSLLEEFDKNALILKENRKYYRKEPAFYQHKPYNYYVGVLQKYLPKEYNSLNRKYLPENL